MTRCGARGLEHREPAARRAAPACDAGGAASPAAAARGGRGRTPGRWRLAVLDLTAKSEGNANGIGLADFTSERAFRKLRFEHTYPNALTTTVPTTVKIPMVLGSDRLAIQAAIKTCGAPDKRRVRLVRIRNTKALGVVHVSEALGDEVERNPSLHRDGPVHDLAFDDRGDLV